MRKSQELRPVMTRIPEGLRSKLAREGKKNGRSMNAEIVYRLEQSFEQGDIIEAVREEISSGFAAGFRDAPQPATFKDDARRAGFKVDARMVAAFKHALRDAGIDPDKTEEEDKS